MRGILDDRWGGARRAIAVQGNIVLRGADAGRWRGETTLDASTSTPGAIARPE
jgi:hypothetical protein